MNCSKNLLQAYLNGNYLVEIYSDGTKIRYLNEEKFKPLFPESIDLKITNYCDNNCLMCHEESSILGRHAYLSHPFLDTLKKGSELAIGGGNPLTHPDLISFLIRMKKQGVICNITINQNHLLKNIDLINYLIKEKLIYGLGISVINKDYLDDIIDFSRSYKNAVIHVIAGIVDEQIINLLSNKSLKLLILGYKLLGRGKSFYDIEIENRINYLKDNILDIGKKFDIISFDNLAIEQLKLKSKINPDDFNSYYMGDDGMFTMYIDLVKEEFSVSSITKIRYPLLNNIFDMFDKIKK